MRSGVAFWAMCAGPDQRGAALALPFELRTGYAIGERLRPITRNDDEIYKALERGWRK